MKLQCWGFVKRCLWVAFVLTCIAGVVYIINDWFVDSLVWRFVLWQIIRVALTIAVALVVTAVALLIYAFLCELQNWLLNGSKDRPGPSPRVGIEMGKPTIKLTRLFGQFPLWSTENYRTPKELVIDHKPSE